MKCNHLLVFLWLSYYFIFILNILIPRIAPLNIFVLQFLLYSIVWIWWCEIRLYILWIWYNSVHCVLTLYNIVVYNIDTNPLLLSLHNVSCSAYLRMAQSVSSNVQAGNIKYLTVFQYIIILHCMINSSLWLSYMLT